MLKKIRLIITGIITLLMLSSLLGLLGFFDAPKGIGEKLGMLMFLIIQCLLLCVIVYYWYGSEHKCPSCNKRFCLKKESTDIIDKETISIPVENVIKDTSGNVIGTQEQYAPGRRITYQVNYVCKKCGAQSFTTYQKDLLE